jgi:DNA-binding CsgD family transcriptional regulator
MTINYGALTEREFAILQLLIEGHTEEPEIAAALHIPTSAASHQLDRLQVHLGMRSRCHLCWTAGRLSLGGPLQPTKPPADPPDTTPGSGGRKRRSVRGQW